MFRTYYVPGTVQGTAVDDVVIKETNLPPYWSLYPHIWISISWRWGAFISSLGFFRAIILELYEGKIIFYILFKAKRYSNYPKR